MKDILEAGEQAFGITDILKNISQFPRKLLFLSTSFKVSVYL